MLGCTVKKIKEKFNVKIVNNEITGKDIEAVKDYVADLNTKLMQKYQLTTPVFNINEKSITFDEKVLKEIAYNEENSKKHNLVDKALLNTDVLYSPTRVFTSQVYTPKAKKDVIRSWKYHTNSMIFRLNNIKQRHLNRKDYISARRAEELISKIKAVQVSDVHDLLLAFTVELSSLHQYIKMLEEEGDLSFIEDTQLKDRMEYLRKFLFVEDLKKNIKHDEVSPDKLPEMVEIETYHALNATFKHIVGPAQTKILKDKLTAIINDFEIAKISYIKNVIKNDPLIDSYKKSGKYSEEDLAGILKMIDNGDIDVNMIEAAVLGIGSGGGLLGQIIGNVRAEHHLEERGAIAEDLQILTSTWDKIKNKTEKGKRIVSSLFERDDKGVKTGRLASIYNNGYFKAINSVNSFIEKIQNFDDESFLKLAFTKEQKSGISRLDFRRLGKVKDAFANDLDFFQYFESNSSKIKEYEESLKKLLGQEVFDDLVEQAIHRVKQFKDYKLASDTPLYKASDARNPFFFLKEYFDNNKLGEIDSEYTIIIPTDSKHLNTELLSKLAKDKDLSKFYLTAFKVLTEYINPTYASEGYNTTNTSLPTNLEVGLGEAIKQKGYLGGISMQMGTILSNYISTFSKEFGKKSERFKSHNIFGVQTAIHNTKTLASKYGLGFINNRLEYEGKLYLDDNLMIALQTGLFAAADIRARRSTYGVVSMFKDLAKDAKYVKSKLEDYEQQNIFGNKMNSPNSGIESKYKIFKIFNSILGKHRNRLEKTLIKSLDELKQKFKDKESGAFVYSKDGNSYLIYNDKTDAYEKYDDKGKKVGEVSLKEIYDSIKDIKKKLKKETGIQITPATMLLGVMQTAVWKHLTLNPVGGQLNRFYGYFRNRLAAASGRYGYNYKQLANARQFLAGYNSKRYLNKFFRNTEKGKKLKTLELLASSLDMLQNRADELANQARFSEKDLSSNLGKLKDFLFDFHINNPEFHNQMENVLSVAQNIEVEISPEFDDGKKHYLFDGKDFIWEPGTLKLKKEYRTPDNIEMWENFKKSESGKSDHIVFFVKAMSAIHKTQGNYDNKDLLPIQNSFTGKIIMFYRRFFPENFDMMWGQRKVDIRFGEKDVRGNLMNLMNHTPTLALYFSSAAFGDLMSRIAVASLVTVAGAPVYVGGAVLGQYLVKVLPGLLFAAYHANKSEISFSKNEMLIAASFMEETMKRVLSMPIEFFTFDKVSGIKYIEKQQKRDLDKLNISEQDRLLLSEASQNLANKAFTYIGLTLLGLAIKAVMVMRMDLDCEGKTQAECDKEKREKLKEIDRKMNYVINVRNRLSDDFNKFENLVAVIGDFTTQASMYTLMKSLVKSLTTDLQKTLDGKKSVRDYTYSHIINNPFIPVPNKVVKGLQNESVTGMFESNRVYERQADWEKKLLYDRYLPKEFLYKRYAKDLRDNYKNEALEMFKDSSKEEQLLIKKRVGDLIKKDKKESYEDNFKVLQSTDKFKEVIRKFGGEKLFLEAINVYYDPETPPKIKRRLTSNYFKPIRLYIHGKIK